MITVTTTVQVPEQRLLDMMISAIDSASIRYWLRLNDVVGEDEDGDRVGRYYVAKLPDGFDPNSLKWLDGPWDPDTCRDYFAPLVEGGSLTLFVEDDRGDGREEIVLDLAAIQRGIAAMAQNEPRHFMDLMSESHDSETADVFVQCCAFGEMVYS